MSITLPQNYRPTERESFMNPMQQEYFRQKLLKWKNELIEESNQTLQNMQEESLAQPDLADRATAETDHSLELRTRDRFRKLISKIDSAMKSIDEGPSGYCEETGEPISLKRLEARPIATLSVEAQERHERLERTRRDVGADSAEAFASACRSCRLSARPARPPPGLPSRHTISPLHSTTSMPLAAEIGFSKVAVSITVAGSKTQMSA